LKKRRRARVFRRRLDLFDKLRKPGSGKRKNLCVLCENLCALCGLERFLTQSAQRKRREVRKDFIRDG
jgi:hypothetical protein